LVWLLERARAPAFTPSVGIITGNNFAAKFCEVHLAQMNCQVL